MLRDLAASYGLRDYQTATWQGGDPGCDHKKPAGGGHGESSPIGKGERDIEIMTSQRYFNVCRKCGAVRTDNQIDLNPPPAFVEKLVQVFQEVRRVLQDDRTVFVDLTTLARAGKAPADPESGLEYVSMKQKRAAARPLTVAIVDPRGSRIKAEGPTGIPSSVAFALQADGWYLRQDIIWHKPNPMPESVKDRCTKAHEYIFLLSSRRNTITMQTRLWNRPLPGR